MMGVKCGMMLYLLAGFYMTIEAESLAVANTNVEAEDAKPIESEIQQQDEAPHKSHSVGIDVSQNKKTPEENPPTPETDEVAHSAARKAPVKQPAKPSPAPGQAGAKAASVGDHIAVVKVHVADFAVHEVVVFPDRADVLRKIKVNLVKGENELVIQGITNSMVRDSVRVAGTGDATILEVMETDSWTDQSDEANRTATMQALRVQLEEAEKRTSNVTKAANREMTRLQVEQELVYALAKRATSTEKTALEDTLKSGGWKSFDELLAYARERAEKLDEGIMVAQARAIAVRELSQKLRDQLTAMERGTDARVSKRDRKQTVRVRFDSRADESVTIDLHYMTYGASWRPSYDCRGMSATSSDVPSVTLTYQGVITQSSEEDWVNTKIMLSTNRPSVGGNVPVLQQEILEIFNPHESSRFSERAAMLRHRATGASGARAMPMMASMSRMEVASAEGASDAAMDESVESSVQFKSVPMMTTQDAHVTEGAIGATYTIGRRSTIPSDNQPHKVVIGVVEVKPEFEYVALPRASPRAFLTAKASNRSPYTMLAGSMQVFLDGNAVTHTMLSQVRPGENFTLSFGADDSVRVKEIPQVKTNEDKGMFFGETTKRTVLRVMSIKNTKEVPVSVLVKDSIPRTAHRDLKVGLQDKTTSGTQGAEVQFKQADSPEELEWICKLPPGVEQTLSVKYTIEWPKDKDIYSRT
eukprot:CAMPEP_0114261082 /NCGR_PEP_ID=MMETSP0058-20121206/20900_1 /TAXON_ID=36894 /ORGANISM="Pyramimonas parkeae, CCMP726" /LENGTH=699 /DNA_ID=CAMNT_0001376499 /DNA_START=166 /DNA_END=2265 /DNA_ORIENTATION=-